MENIFLFVERIQVQLALAWSGGHSAEGLLTDTDVYYLLLIQT